MNICDQEGTPLPDINVDDLCVSDVRDGGFAMVKLYEADDHETIILNENQIIALRDYLMRACRDYDIG